MLVVTLLLLLLLVLVAAAAGAVVAAPAASQTENRFSFQLQQHNKNKKKMKQLLRSSGGHLKLASKGARAGACSSYPLSPQLPSLAHVAHVLPGDSNPIEGFCSRDEVQRSPQKSIGTPCCDTL